MLIILLASCAQGWDYEGSSAAQNWGDLRDEFKFCGIGYNQSPIDIDAKFDKAGLKFSYSLSQVDKIAKNHVAQISFFNRDYVSRGRKKYFTRQFHFHHPSEHLVKGEQYSLEMQVFHKSDDEQWLVLAIFLKIGTENSDFKQVVDLLENKEIAGEIDLSNIVNEKDETFFYDGSFTIPPCTEGVKWYVMKTPIEISKEQMNKIIKKGIFVPSNARPVQEFHLDRY